MCRVQVTHALPANFAEFIREIAEGIGGLYGPQAAHNHREMALEAIQASMANQGVCAFVAQQDGDAAGILLAFERHNAGHIDFIHVLRAHCGKGIEDLLVRECVRTFRARGLEAILSECIPFCALDVHATYQSLGFEHVSRALMTACPENLLSSGCNNTSTPLLDSQHLEAASVIVDAYIDHPGRRLHVEVSREETALAFVQRVADGQYGPVHPDYLRSVSHRGRMAGVIFGCEIAPNHGFILQIAVRRSHQRQGVGISLLTDLASAFHRTNMTRMVLGITISSPAHALYQRLGFQPLRQIDAYTWWPSGSQI